MNVARVEESNCRDFLCSHSGHMHASDKLEVVARVRQAVRSLHAEKRVVGQALLDDEHFEDLC